MSEQPTAAGCSRAAGDGPFWEKPIQGFTESLRCELIHGKGNVKFTMVQMPAMNTPKFDWVKSRLPRKPQPVTPIYQPEVGADAVVWAAHHYRREWYVGGSTAIVIAGNKMAPAWVTGTWAGRATIPSSTTATLTPIGPTTCTSRCRAITEPKAISTAGRRTMVSSRGWASTAPCFSSARSA
jgi:hypothetical protein